MKQPHPLVFHRYRMCHSDRIFLAHISVLVFFSFFLVAFFCAALLGPSSSLFSSSSSSSCPSRTRSRCCHVHDTRRPFFSQLERSFQQVRAKCALVVLFCILRIISVVFFCSRCVRFFAPPPHDIFNRAVKKYAPGLLASTFFAKCFCPHPLGPMKSKCFGFSAICAYDSNHTLDVLAPRGIKTFDLIDSIARFWSSTDRSGASPRSRRTRPHRSR